MNQKNLSTGHVDNLDQPSLVIAQQLYQRIQALDAKLNESGVAPTGQDYNTLFDLVSDELRKLLDSTQEPRRRRTID